MRTKLCAAAASVALITATVSLSAAPPEAQAAEQRAVEARPTEGAALPAIAVAAAAGLVGAFALGALQGYMEAKNEQNKQKQQADETGGISAFRHLSGGNFDYVLD